jgi:hypothetical protein
MEDGRGGRIEDERGRNVREEGTGEKLRARGWRRGIRSKGGGEEGWQERALAVI